jgi:hypothetical protein
MFFAQCCSSSSSFFFLQVYERVALVHPRPFLERFSLEESTRAAIYMREWLLRDLYNRTKGKASKFSVFSVKTKCVSSHVFLFCFFFAGMCLFAAREVLVFVTDISLCSRCWIASS